MIFFLQWGHAFPVTPDSTESVEVNRFPNDTDGKMLLRSKSFALKHRVLELGTSANPSIMDAPAAVMLCAFY